MDWEVVIGLEIHAQLATESKIFSGAATRYGAEPNTQACLVDLGYPGVLPVLNSQVVDMAIRFGLATHCTIAARSIFARKNYFYPDLPKGYQISQYELPIVHSGHIDLVLDDGETKRVGITRAHLEEDAGKSLHEDFHGMSGIDLNRAGTPLLEIVSEPELRSAREAGNYMRAIHTLVRYLGICDGNMQEGSFRCDANVSVRPAGTTELGTRTELKNLNSFRFVQRALEYEVERQRQILEQGDRVVQETRLYDADKGVTFTMRSKEEAHDYRYFPEPDLVPIVVSEAWSKSIAETLPELPEEKRERFVRDFGIPAYDAGVLTSSRSLADYYEDCLARLMQPKLVSNWIMGELLRELKNDDREIDRCPVDPKALTDLLKLVEDGTVSGKMAKTVFEEMYKTGKPAGEIVKEKGLTQISDSSTLERLIDEVLEKNPAQVAEYRGGKEKVFGYLVGQAMKATRGQGNPALVNQLLKKKLG
jgi:aspartyl-tRNA(Asn)/glutamyl-tRNA(Gln) amidotransferase subunit B